MNFDTCLLAARSEKREESPVKAADVEHAAFRSVACEDLARAGAPVHPAAGLGRFPDPARSSRVELVQPLLRNSRMAVAQRAPPAPGKISSREQFGQRPPCEEAGSRQRPQASGVSAAAAGTMRIHVIHSSLFKGLVIAVGLRMMAISGLLSSNDTVIPFAYRRTDSPRF